MTDHYQMTKSTGFTTDVREVMLDPPGGVSGDLTRKVVKAEIVINGKDANKPVNITLLHQKRHSTKEEWQNAESFNLATLKAGQEVRLVLSCSQTYQLYRVLDDLHRIGSGGLPEAGSQIAIVDLEQAVVVEDDAGRILKNLLDSEGEAVWKALDKLKPGLLQAAALKQQHQLRAEAVAKFREKLTDPHVREQHWQHFLERNDWIFGHGLDYRYLHRLRAQAYLGGTELDGTGGVRGDFLMATEAHVSFTMLVEIKTPQTTLLGKSLHRSKAYELGPELTGGVAQVQAQCAVWAEEGARQRNNQEQLDGQRRYTNEPEGILIIGNTAQLADDPDKWNTFERFRRSLHNPRIVTFDELLGRAEFLVRQMEKEPQGADTRPGSVDGSV